MLIYTHEFPPFRGGAGVYSYDLAAGLESLGQAVHIVTPRQPRGRRREPEVARNERFQMHYLETWQMRPGVARLYLAWLCLRHRIDCVLVTERCAQETVTGMASVPFAYVAILHGTEVLQYFRDDGADCAVSSAAMRDFYRQADLCIAVSEATRRLAERLLNDSRIRLESVQNGIDPDRLPEASADDVARLKRRYGPDSQILFCLGRLGPDKGQDVLLRAFGHVIRECPRARLLVAGDGPTRASLADLRDQLGLGDRLQLLGEIPSALLPSYFAACDLFVLPSRCESRWEGFGLVYLEAAFYAKACIGGNEGGVPEAVTHGETGLVVDPRNEEAVAGAIVYLLQNDEARSAMGEAGRRRVMDFYHCRRMAQETLKLIEPRSGSEGVRVNHVV